MDEVYRAHDSKLNRDVALKVLLPEVADNPERLARFRRAAQILASLNHHDIGHIYGLEGTDGVVAGSRTCKVLRLLIGLLTVQCQSTKRCRLARRSLKPSKPLTSKASFIVI